MSFFFFNDTATTEIYTLSLHDALPIYAEACAAGWEGLIAKVADSPYVSGRSKDWLKLKCIAEQEVVVGGWTERSEEHTSELQSRQYPVCRLLLETKTTRITDLYRLLIV